MPRQTTKIVKVSGDLQCVELLREAALRAAGYADAPRDAKVTIRVDVGSYEMRAADVEDAEFTYTVEWTEES